MNGNNLSTEPRLNNLVANADALCRLIKVCGQSNVREFKNDQMHLVFGVADRQAPKTLETVQTKPSEQVIRKIESEVEAQRTAERVRDELENLKILDPLAYEQLIEGEIDVGDSP